jgi:hypothetical protein
LRRRVGRQLRDSAGSTLHLTGVNGSTIVDDIVLERITRRPAGRSRVAPGEIRGFCVVTATPDTIRPS